MNNLAKSTQKIVMTQKVMSYFIIMQKPWRIA